MNRLTRPTEVPEVLRGRGAVAAQALCIAYDADPQAYLNGVKQFELDASLYAAPAVKQALREMQHDKRAFCESKFSHTGYGDVEHYRPKGGYLQKPDDNLGKPGYFWLAYEWTNLFYSCQLCNQRFKRNLFPLRRSTRRARSHHDAIGGEEPLLINPAETDPSRHLGFHEERAIPRRNSVVGRVTIEFLGLNRPELRGMRGQWLEDLRLYVETRNVLAVHLATDPAPHLKAQLGKLDARLEQVVRDDAQYAAMNRAFFAGMTLVPGPRERSGSGSPPGSGQEKSP